MNQSKEISETNELFALGSLLATFIISSGMLVGGYIHEAATNNGLSHLEVIKTIFDIIQS